MNLLFKEFKATDNCYSLNQISVFMLNNSINLDFKQIVK